MEDQFYDNDFEKFLQQQVKHHRMYPSDAVWKGIYKQMHGYKRWPGLYFFAILIVASLTLCTIFIESETIVYPAQPVVAKAVTPKYNQLDPAQITEHTIRSIHEETNEADANTYLPSLYVTNLVVKDVVTVSRPVEIAATYDELSNNSSSSISPGIINDITPLQPNENIAVITLSNANPFKAKNGKKKVPSLSALIAEEETTQSASDNITDKYLEENPEEVDRIAQQKVRTKQPKWNLQFYIAPSMNYRNIVDEKAKSQQNGPVTNNYGVDASKVIRYDPGMGIEFGLGVLYSVNKRINVKAALQYNIRQYNIEAYAGNTELAKIALTRGGFIDTMRALSNFRSTGTGVYGEAQLLNKYHQLSLPVGIEYALLTSNRFGFNLGGTIQPTYTFSESSYLLSSDYKSYADGKSILRRWNLNSSVEAMFTYKTRTVQWKFGPQLRYQHLPNYTDAYAIKEYLIDYGFKIGFTKAIQ